MFDNRSLEQIKKEIEYERFNKVERELSIYTETNINKYFFDIFGNKYVVIKEQNNENKEESFKLILIAEPLEDRTKTVSVNEIIKYEAKDIYEYLSKYYRIEQLKKEIDKLETELQDILI